MATKNKYADITIEPLVPVDIEDSTVEENTETKGKIDIEVAAERPVYEKKREHMGVKAKRTVGNVIIYVILCIMTVVWLFPFFGILMESFRVESPGVAGYIIPQQFGFDNYVKLSTDPEMHFWKWFLNTAVMG